MLLRRTRRDPPTRKSPDALGSEARGERFSWPPTTPITALTASRAVAGQARSWLRANPVPRAEPHAHAASTVSCLSAPSVRARLHDTEASPDTRRARLARGHARSRLRLRVSSSRRRRRGGRAPAYTRVFRARDRQHRRYKPLAPEPSRACDGRRRADLSCAAAGSRRVANGLGDVRSHARQRDAAWRDFCKHTRSKSFTSSV